ncbi:DUF4240 domain-containing protein [Paenibacillus sp. KQZ6P-2]|uniref:DUF4240 domain-containing protein n=1 Tax=Paenibacillus mangrovi TaxID=2931978 RepID=A0A9X1WRP5_9BACL|nr:DUF4240 domain-containing protein [Paenibacillus mangrovi]MCJ8012200.1 DUF4240 domain-containing protein [Paenibacillus mangrovi]
MKTKKTNAHPGDLFVVVLPDGRYGAIRIINQVDKSLLIAVTTYLEPRIPSVSDQQLQMILIQNRFSYKNESAISWYDGKIPKDFLYIGNIPVSEHEKMVECNKYSGSLSSSCAHPVYWEWRWLNDRENYENEIQAERLKREEENKHRIHVPKQMMTDVEFWTYISMLDLQQKDEEDAASPLVMKLAKTSVSNIKRFDETLAYKLYLLDTKEHAKQIGEFAYNEEEDYISADGFLYARCAAVAKGKFFYELALNSPCDMPKDEGFEILISIAHEAYVKRTGKEYYYGTGCSYESFENKEGWR